MSNEMFLKKNISIYNTIEEIQKNTRVKYSSAFSAFGNASLYLGIGSYVGTHFGSTFPEEMCLCAVTLGTGLLIVNNNCFKDGKKYKFLRETLGKHFSNENIRQAEIFEYKSVKGFDDDMDFAERAILMKDKSGKTHIFQEIEDNGEIRFTRVDEKEDNYQKILKRNEKRKNR